MRAGLSTECFSFDILIELIHAELCHSLPLNHLQGNGQFYSLHSILVCLIGAELVVMPGRYFGTCEALLDLDAVSQSLESASKDQSAIVVLGSNEHHLSGMLQFH